MKIPKFEIKKMNDATLEESCKEVRCFLLDFLNGNIHFQQMQLYQAQTNDEIESCYKQIRHSEQAIKNINACNDDGLLNSYFVYIMTITKGKNFFITLGSLAYSFDLGFNEYCKIVWKEMDKLNG